MDKQIIYDRLSRLVNRSFGMALALTALYGYFFIEDRLHPNADPLINSHNPQAAVAIIVLCVMDGLIALAAFLLRRKRTTGAAMGDAARR